jgi:tungstate transport system substrate-binding protein
VLWASAEVKPAGDWYEDMQTHGKRAFKTAEQKGAYILWGLPPYLRLKQEGEIQLEPLVLADPLFQRIMVAIVINPAKVPGVNATGARAFEEFLLAPATQAWIRAFRYPDIPEQVWWPAGRHNNARE